MSYDFSGYATRNDLKCADGRTIRKDAFKDNDGQVVPLVWQHQHNNPDNVLGHCELENRDDGVYAYCSFNDTQSGLNARKLVEHGDVTSLSIYANHLVESAGSVLHGAIKEVSLVLSGANPGAFIDNIAFAHSDDVGDTLEEAIIYTGDMIDLWPEMAHADDEDDDQNESDYSEDEDEDDDETIGDIFDSMTEEQQTVVSILCEQAENGDLDLDEDEIEHSDTSEKTVEDVFDSMTEKQRNVAFYLIGLAAESYKEDESNMSHYDYDDGMYEYDEYDEYFAHADEEDDGTTVGDILENMSEAKQAFVEKVVKAARSGDENPDIDPDIWDDFTTAEKNVTAYLVGSALKHFDEDDYYLSHADDEDEDEDDEEETEASDEEIVAGLSRDKKNALEAAMNGEISQADFAVVWGKFTQPERDAVMALINKDKNIKHDDLEGGDTTMSYNVFDNYDYEDTYDNVLSHADTEAIFADAKRYGSLKESFLAHTAGATTTVTGGVAGTNYGIGNVDYLFPDAQLVDKNVELIRNNPTDWVAKVMNGIKKSPFSRIKTMYADVTAATARAKGYVKSNKKEAEVITLLKRETTPTTVYKMQKLDRDDILDITDFNVVAWLKAEMKVMLEEEIARAILIGDGRTYGTDTDAIDPSKIRPIVSDTASDIYAVKHSYSVGASANEYEVFIDECNLAKVDYEGTGSPVLFVSPAYLANMLILKDGENRRMYRGKEDLANALGVKEIIEVPQMATATLTFTTTSGSTTTTSDVKGIMVNLSDYTVGMDKGAQINMFDDFDIDFNQQKYLIETRLSGALTKYHSAIILGKAQTQAAG